MMNNTLSRCLDKLDDILVAGMTMVERPLDKFLNKATPVLKDLTKKAEQRQIEFERKERELIFSIESLREQQRQLMAPKQLEEQEYWSWRISRQQQGIRVG